jgi:hypothetical protein
MPSLALRLLILALLILTFSLNQAAGIVALAAGFGYAVSRRAQHQRIAVPAELESEGRL